MRSVARREYNGLTGPVCQWDAKHWITLTGDDLRVQKYNNYTLAMKKKRSSLVVRASNLIFVSVLK